MHNLYRPKVDVNKSEELPPPSSAIDSDSTTMKYVSIIVYKLYSFNIDLIYYFCWYLLKVMISHIC